jgi:hypothetical protein
VDQIHRHGGTVLGTSRGPVDVGVAVDHLLRRGVNVLFTIGGDGTQRGGNALFQEARRRGHALAVVGIPKTNDNDVAFVSRSCGYLTAIEEAAKVQHCAHTEAHSVHNGIALVKLTGRDAGFIAAGATVAKAMDCAVGEECVRGGREAAGAPTFMRIDFDKKTIAGPHRASPVLYMDKSEKQLLLQGTEMGYGWAMAIDQANGRMTVTLVDREGAFMLSGNCTPL